MEAVLEGVKSDKNRNVELKKLGSGLVVQKSRHHHSEVFFEIYKMGMVSWIKTINKTETYRDPDSFADIVRGMHLYGRKILRPEAIVTAKYNAA